MHRRPTLLYSWRTMTTAMTIIILLQEGLAVASIARDVVVEMTPPRDHDAR